MKSFVLAAFLFTALFSYAQPKPTELDKSPMDMSYWPANYPILKMSGKAKDQPVARVIYGRPMKNGRVIFGGIIKYNEMWRLGANEATEIETFRTLKIGSKILAKGRYTVYCLPNENKWTIIFNKDNFCWGNFTYDSKKDLIRTDIDVEKNTESVEAFTLYFEDAKNGANLVFLWDDIKTILPIVLAEETTSKKK
ncbi:MAG: DUF2911 domain-containing protein [Bacteroidetes bacterium]|nr:DUF2911 domain-containing protein [Bacteroidota bacterium]